MPDIKSFQDLPVWQKGHSFVLEIYRLTNGFPKTEAFGLTNQMQRAAVSITSNLAEGYGRTSVNDKCHFYTISMGSLRELQNQIIISKDLKYINLDEHNRLMDLSDEILKLIYSIIRRTRSRARPAI